MRSDEDEDTNVNSECDEARMTKRIKISDKDEVKATKILNSKFQTCNEGTSYERETINDIKISEENTTVNIEEVKTVITKRKSMGLEEMLMCNICCDIMYHCTSIRPCLHAFCGGCLFDWMESGDVCPMCRGPIDGVSKNHLLMNIINKYLENHPDKVKPESEREEADIKVLNGMNKISSNKTLTADLDSSMQLSLNGCPYCHYPNLQHSNISFIDLSEAPLSQYQCTSSTGHIQCQCCNIYIPVLTDTEQYPRQKCQICNMISCSLLLGSCRNCLHGCLNVFKNFVFNPNLNSNNQVPQFLPENFYETNVLRNYLNSQNITVSEMFKDCIDKVFRGEINLGHAIDGTTALCLNCSRQMVLDMVYEYFRQIPRSCLPSDVTSRPDCYFGRHCRTQRTRQHHAINYNHACPQTRF